MLVIPSSATRITSSAEHETKKNLANQITAREWSYFCLAVARCFSTCLCFQITAYQKNCDFLNVLRDTISVDLSTQRSLIHTHNLFITLFSDKVQLNNAARLSPLVMILVLVFS